ncbi:hypothetical protein [Brevundimonas sp. GCM10030266]|uniref:hypothetical protein n=1 Tax=Brevundimonas sp. GCM10030266 TaxID=3273386 RepID=UPI003609C490
MKALVASAALLTLAAAPVAIAQTASPPPAAQTPPPAAAPGSDFTRDLNGGPPRPAEYLAPAPTPAPVVTPPPAAPAAEPRPAVPVAPAAPTETTPRPVPRLSTPPMTATAPASPSPAAPVIAPTPRPAAPTPTPAPATVAPAPEPVAPPPPPSVPTVTVLDAAARAALPFTAELPSGFQIVTGRPGPDFRIYTIRRGEQSFVMVYVGPASQFPIYSGEQVEAGGRTSVVVTENGQRRALEHLFQRTDAPREVHIWTMSLDGADRALAERIAQSVDLR